MTDEDVLPQWLRTVLLDRVPGLSAPALPRVKLRVCEACNRQSNRAFEEPARPVIKRMLSGTPFVLSTEDARHVGLWALKTEGFYGLMRHWRDDMQPSVHPQFAASYNQTEAAERRRLEQHALVYNLMPPVNSTVSVLWIRPGRAWRRQPILNRADGAFQTYGVTNVYPLLFESITGDAEPAEQQRMRHADPRFAVLWPVAEQHAVRWPPAPASLRDVVAYQARFGRRAHVLPLVRGGPGW